MININISYYLTIDSPSEYYNAVYNYSFVMWGITTQEMNL
jgi:hypothetical protein